MADHTPGPWQFWRGKLHPDEHETRGVMRPGRHAQIQTDHEPDLHLIAAAPELFEACEKAAKVYDLLIAGKVSEIDPNRDLWADLALLRSAVAKANGFATTLSADELIASFNRKRNREGDASC